MARDIAAPGRTKEILEHHGFSFKKSLGQNFLIDRNILEKIVLTSKAGAEDGVIEIGPGIGGLTEHFAKAAKQVEAFEIDGRLLPVLEETMAPCKNVRIWNEDILNVDIRRVLSENFKNVQDIIVTGNLPYYVTTPIIMNLLEQRLPISRMVFMMQKEVAERLAAEPGSKDYGSLSIAAQYFADPVKTMVVPKTVFIPKPNVDSAVVRFEIRDTPPVEVEDEAFFFRVIKAAFAQRRKTIWNNLQHNLTGRDRREELAAALQEAGIDSGRRGETLTMQEFARLSTFLKRHLH
ncbi:16S rRNA (adenine(1518)-N(6)/adenine(1519)-N(6))-dimethyltransferase RsmA [Salibacterium qingdaonense]|uniref:Ribosomal RNA small subunit methyltransferase A n=1 Tax=Salibacterium qingdaonense TaxID=266892 RepID=A0A1I4QJZ5_9BACI|nr:16S rRNA (adenine(1518)-N(6)/adenine(1519)-N(6))-dimethyltransferase RsmA [Salibacterium qingdaonense]SFM40381.1 16S rRNA (adenine1518-N6/adenine1519-N6)-dimethyltransferase [Salibacterium qingdaonense]